MSEVKTPDHGVNEKTPDNILFGAGTIHKNLKFSSTWNFEESLVGATKGGSKLSIKPEIFRPELDGVTVNVKELTKKVGESAQMEINFAEMSEAVLQASTLMKKGESDAASYDLLETKADLETGDFWDNVAFVGKTMGGKDIIVIMGNALCTSGLDTDPKHKDTAVAKATFECHQTIAGNLTTLPVKIYYPSAQVIL